MLNLRNSNDIIIDEILVLLKTFCIMCNLIILFNICKLCESCAKTGVYRSEEIIFIGIEKKSISSDRMYSSEIECQKKTFADVNIHCKTRGL